MSTPNSRQFLRAQCPFWLRRPRLTLMLLTLLSTGLATWLFSRLLSSDGMDILDYPLAGLFAVLFVWVAFSFWTATLGFLSLLRQPRHHPTPAVSPTDKKRLPRSAILMPIYNEDPTSVFAGLRAIIRSLRENNASELFDVFVLSDTTNPDIWLEEERAWARLVSQLPQGARVFYRHRPKNLSRKAGNIADFCTRWGDHYPYMIVLDADSVMSAETMVEMVRRMERDAEIGILQIPPTPVNRQSFFARMQQFASRAYGPVFLEGFALWSKCDGNYWGHNAIIRVQPFIEHCDLPILPGQGPLGGEILSHDFVEAALMRRAGWKVCLAHDLDGSYEECPTTMMDYAQRDQRWCQGNMQHTRLLLADGFHPASRLHLGMGVMSYLASPLWLLFLAVTVLGTVFGHSWLVGASASGGATLFCITMAMLLLPKLWAVIALSRQPKRLKGHGGWTGAITSALLETVVSVLIAPIMMLLHTHFVVSTFLGRKVSWNAQARDERNISLNDAVEVHFPHVVFGLGTGLVVWWLTPALFPWTLPVIIGPALAVPLSMILGSADLGQQLAKWNLLLIPEEIDRPAILQWQRDALKEEPADRKQLFASVLYDPAFYALHVGILQATDSNVPVPTEQLNRILEKMREGGAQAVTTDDRRAVLNDPSSLTTLHIAARSQPSRSRSVLLA